MAGCCARGKVAIALLMSHLLVYTLLQYSDSRWIFYSYFQGQKRTLTSKNCLKSKFEDILLVIAYNFPLYKSIPILLSLYQKTFPNIYICGPQRYKSYTVNQLPIHKGYFAYECLSEAMFTNSNYSGYLFLMDDVLLNFWTLHSLDKKKLWEGPKQPIEVENFKPPVEWYWWKSRWGKANCQRAFDEIAFMRNDSIDYELMASNFLNNLRHNGKGRYRCHRGRSDIFYVPKRFTTEFTLLSSVFRKHEVFLEIAVPTIFRFLDLSWNFEHLNGYYLPGKVGEKPVTDSKYLWMLYRENITFIHPLKLHYGSNSTLNLWNLQNYIFKKVTELTNCTNY